jgi:hypothetical protein
MITVSAETRDKLYSMELSKLLVLPFHKHDELGFQLNENIEFLVRDYIIPGKIKNLETVRDFIYGKTMNAVGVFSGKGNWHSLEVTNESELINAITSKNLLSNRKRALIGKIEKKLGLKENLLEKIDNIIEHFHPSIKYNDPWIDSLELEKVNLQLDMINNGNKYPIGGQRKTKSKNRIAAKIAEQLYRSRCKIGPNKTLLGFESIRLYDFSAFMIVGMHAPGTIEEKNDVITRLKRNIINIFDTPNIKDFYKLPDERNLKVIHMLAGPTKKDYNNLLQLPFSDLTSEKPYETGEHYIRVHLKDLFNVYIDQIGSRRHDLYIKRDQFRKNLRKPGKQLLDAFNQRVMQYLIPKVV